MRLACGSAEPTRTGGATAGRAGLPCGARLSRRAAFRRCATLAHAARGSRGAALAGGAALFLAAFSGRSRAGITTLSALSPERGSTLSGTCATARAGATACARAPAHAFFALACRAAHPGCASTTAGVVLFTTGLSRHVAGERDEKGEGCECAGIGAMHGAQTTPLTRPTRGTKVGSSGDQAQVPTHRCPARLPRPLGKRNFRSFRVDRMPTVPPVPLSVGCSEVVLLHHLTKAHSTVVGAK